MKLYFKFLSIHLKSSMQHKGSFIIVTIGQFLTTFLSFLGITFLLQRFNAVGSFAYSEVIMCFSVVLVAFSLAECFARGFDRFSAIIGNGEFDRILIRPKSAVFQVLCSKIELTRLGRFIQAAIMLIIAVKTGNIEWNMFKIFVLALSVLCGAVFFSALFAVGAAVCFYSTQSLEVLNIFTDGGREFGSYPLSVYGKKILKFYTFIIPMALFQYYPFMYVIGRTDNLMYAAAPVFSLLFLIPVSILWHAGLKHYKSTGS